MGKERLATLVQESVTVAVKTGAAKPADVTRVIVDTTVQEKVITVPPDAKLMHTARERLVRLAKKVQRRAAPELCAGPSLQALSRSCRGTAMMSS